MPARFNQISIDLSKLLNDQVNDAHADGQEYSAAQRTLVVNKAEEIFIQKALDEKGVDGISKDIPELLSPVTAVSNFQQPPFPVPAGVARVIQVWNAYLHIRADAKDYDAIVLGFNPEETQAIYYDPNNPQYRWAEMGSGVNKQILQFPNWPVSAIGRIYMRYISDHTDLTPDSPTDLIVPARYDPELLTIAYGYLTALLKPKK